MRPIPSQGRPIKLLPNSADSPALEMQDHISNYTAPIRLNPNRVALVIVDMQYASASPDHGIAARLKERGEDTFVKERFEAIGRMLPTLKATLAAARARMIPVIHVTFGSGDASFMDISPRLRRYAQDTNNRVGTHDHEILKELQSLPDEIVLRKTTISAFASTGIDSILRTIGRDQLMFAGVSTNSCVDTSARDASDRGFECVILSDCCAATRYDLHEAALTTFGRLFGRVMSSSAAIAELDETASA